MSPPLLKPRPLRPESFRVMIADHQVLVRSAIRLLLETKGGFPVVAEAGDGQETLILIAKARPDIVLLDVAMPKIDGIEVTKRISDGYPATRVLALTALEEQKYVRAALAAGAAGYVPKTATAAELMEAIRTVASGGRYVHPRVASACAIDPEHSTVNVLLDLTPRESEVVRLVALGYSHKEAASQLNIGVKTLETHKLRALQKLGRSSRADLLQFALEKGWIVPGQSSDQIAASTLLDRHPGCMPPGTRP